MFKNLGMKVAKNQNEILIIYSKIPKTNARIPKSSNIRNFNESNEKYSCQSRKAICILYCVTLHDSNPGHSLKLVIQVIEKRLLNTYEILDIIQNIRKYLNYSDYTS